ncbi:alpha/beta hydrolase [Proteiniclasticum sp. C24MP]|uniref:alpha/beta hydrolase n=1 Tax=Proteiniclasticum sp. C24MP TaxID=3374101 RepID=UPI0037550CF3
MMKKPLILFAAAVLLLTGSCGKKEETIHLVDDKYQEENVSVLFEEGELKGSLMWPVVEGEGNLVIIVPGSGPTDRNGNNPQAGENNNLLMIAEALSEAGHYSLRYDKRGIGESSDLIKKESDMDFHDSVNDVLSWITKFKGDTRFEKIILLGHSEGALISAEVCSISSDCDALISVSGTAQKAHELLLAQLKAQSQEAYEMSVPIVEELVEGNMVPEVPVSLFNLFRPSVQPYLISWFSYDPVKIISEITDPILILHGDRDIQISHKEAQVLHEASPDSQLEIIEGMNHVLKDAPEDLEGNIATYSDPDLPLSKEFMEKVIEFIGGL